MKKTIAIIGAGEAAGATMAQRLAEADYPVLLMDKDAEKSKTLQHFLAVAWPTAEVDVVNCSYECAWEADVVVLAVPDEELQPVAEKIRMVVTRKPVIRIADSAGTLQTLFPPSIIVPMACASYILNYLRPL